MLNLLESSALLAQLFFPFSVVVVVSDDDGEQVARQERVCARGRLRDGLPSEGVPSSSLLLPKRKQQKSASSKH